MDKNKYLIYIEQRLEYFTFNLIMECHTKRPDTISLYFQMLSFFCILQAVRSDAAFPSSRISISTGEQKFTSECWPWIPVPSNNITGSVSRARVRLQLVLLRDYHWKQNHPHDCQLLVRTESKEIC